MKLRATLPLGLLAFSVLAFAAQGIDLKWTPKVGDKASYKIAGTFEIPGAGDVKISGTRVEEISKIDGDIVTSTSSSKMSAEVMGNEIPIPDSKEMTKSKLDGTVTEVRVDDKEPTGNGLRLAHISMLVFPGKAIAINDTWTATGEKDEKLDVPGYKIEYKLVGEEKIGDWDTYKITSKGGETEGAAPTKVDGTFWVEKSTGVVVKGVSQLTDAVFDPQYPALSGKMEINRQP